MAHDAKTERDVGRELERARSAERKLAAELLKVGEELAVQGGEHSLRLEEAFARGQAPPREPAKLRELREHAGEIPRQLAVLAHQIPRLAVEALELELEAKRSEQRSLEEEFAESEARLRAASASHQEGQNRVLVAVEEAREIEYRLREAGDRLAAMDPAVHERRLQEAEQRREVAERTFGPESEFQQRVRREALAAGGFRITEGG